VREKLSDVWFRVVVPIEAVGLFIGAALHLGISIGGINEPKIISATVVETVIGAGLAVAAYVYAGGHDSWPGFIIGAQILAMAGVLIGIAAINFGGGQSTLGNDIFHRVLLVTLGTGLVLAALESGVIRNREGAQGTMA